MEPVDVFFYYYLAFYKMLTSRIGNLPDINIFVYCLQQLFILFMFIGNAKTKTIINCIPLTC